MARKVPPPPPLPPADDPREYERPSDYGDGVFEATTGPRDVAELLGPPSEVVTEQPEASDGGTP